MSKSMSGLWLVAFTAALGAALAPRSAAAQSVGDLRYQGCVGSGTCWPIGAWNPLEAPARVAMTPDGSSAYVIASGYDDQEGTWGYAQVSHFRLPAYSPMTYAGCIGNPGTPALCTNAGAAAMLGLIDVAALNGSVYTLSHEGDIVHFRRSSNGDLTYAGCLGQAAHGCYDTGANVLGPGAAGRLAASSDARNLYVLSTVGYGQAIAVLDRLSNGDLVYAGCIGQNVAGCTPLPAGVSGAFGNYSALIAAGSDPASSNIYVLSGDGVLSRFNRAANGSLWFGDCIGAGPGVSGCAAPPVNGLGISLLSGGVDLRSAHNGATLFVLRDHSVARLDRQWNGTVRFGGCFGTQTGAIVGADNSAVGCTPISAPNDVFAGLRQLAVSEDGSGWLYTIAGGGSIAELSEAASYRQCWGAGTGCARLGAAVNNGIGLVMSSSSAVVIGTPAPAYYASPFDGTAYSFSRTSY